MKIGYSPLDVILDAERALIVQPDLFFISNERSHILMDRVRGAPISSSKCSHPTRASGSSASDRLVPGVRRQGVLADSPAGATRRGVELQRAAMS